MAERTHARLAVLTVADSASYGLGSAWAAFSAAELIDAEQKSKQRTSISRSAACQRGCPSTGGC